ncbi:MAG: DUF3499 family protein [Actinobacteria bacterium]|jgi:hypothetical protein|nr:DUF3499 family protein [Actinomycetota bacterium]
MRRCAKMGCGEPAVLTLTYIYSDSTVVLGPLATFAEPHNYDLCNAHGEKLTPPRGWELIKLAAEEYASGPTHDDLLAIAEAVRSVASPQTEVIHPTLGRRGHLRALPSE